MKNNIVIPTYAQLIENTFIALKELGDPERIQKSTIRSHS